MAQMLFADVREVVKDPKKTSFPSVQSHLGTDDRATSDKLVRIQRTFSEKFGCRSRHANTRNASMAFVREQLSPQVDTALQSVKSLNGVTFQHRPRALDCGYWLKLVPLALHHQCNDVHDALCAIVAHTLDNVSLGAARSELQITTASDMCCGSNVVQTVSSLATLPEASVITILSHVRDLRRAVQLSPAWQPLLRTPAAEVVYAPRIGAVAPLYRNLLAAHPGMTWQDAWMSFVAVCDGTAPLGQLEQLIGMSLESLTVGTPKHLGELTFLLTLLSAASVAHSPNAAASALLSAALSIHSNLQSRLCAVSNSPPSFGAVEYYCLLARSKELLSRSLELAHVALPPSLLPPFLARISALQDELHMNFSLSDKASAFLRALSPAAVAQNPHVSALLSGPFCNMIPQAERVRLALPRATINATSFGAIQVQSVSVRCAGGAVVAVPPTLLRPLSHLRTLYTMFAKWLALAGGESLPNDAFTAVPLPVKSHIFRSVLDGAHAVTLQPVLGGEAARVACVNSWVQEMRGDHDTAVAVVACARMLGFQECLQLLGACDHEMQG